MTKYEYAEQTLVFPEVLLILSTIKEKPLLIAQLCSRTVGAYETQPLCPPSLSPAERTLL